MRVLVSSGTRQRMGLLALRVGNPSIVAGKGVHAVSKPVKKRSHQLKYTTRFPETVVWLVPIISVMSRSLDLLFFSYQISSRLHSQLDAERIVK